MRKTKLLLASVSALAASAFLFTTPAQAEQREFQCSTGYRIMLPSPGPNGVIETTKMFDRLIFESDGLWQHDDTNIAFRLSGQTAVLDVDGREIACEQVAKALPTTSVEPASARAVVLPGDKPQTSAAVSQSTSSKTGRVVAPEPTESTAALNSDSPLVPPISDDASDVADADVAALEAPAAELPAEVDATTTTGSLILVPDEIATAALTGESRGGRLRSGPGTDFAIAGAIEAGTPVKIVENAGNTYRGFDWFEIEYGDGQRAFTWGGILCSDGEKADGVFEVCG